MTDQVPPSPASQPPTMRSPILPSPPVWPSVLGVIAIVFGSLATLQGPLVLLLPLMKEAMSQFPTPGAPPLDFLDKWSVWIYTNAALASALGIFLLVAGIRIVKRRRNGPALVKTWAVIKLLWGAAGVPLNIMMQQDNLRAMQQNASSGQSAAISGAVVDAMVIVGAIIGFVWVAALPVFVLIWFSRARVREETAKWA